MKQTILDILTSNQARTFYWTTFNGCIVISIAILGEFNAMYIPFAIAGLSALTKHINLTYL